MAGGGSGEAVADLAPLVARYAPEAVLINCSRPEAVTDAIKRMNGAAMPTGAYANGFTRITEDLSDFEALKAEWSQSRTPVTLGPDGRVIP